MSRPWPEGGVSRPRRELCIPACTEADTPLQQTATAANGTHPTGMHSCFSMQLLLTITFLNFLALRIASFSHSQSLLPVWF